MPTVAAEVEQIRAAHHVRGVRPGWGPRGLWRRLRAFAIPLLAAAIRRADQVARAMDRPRLRPRGRTYFRAQRFRAADAVFLAGAVLAVALTFFALHRLGLLGALNPFQ